MLTTTIAPSRIQSGRVYRRARLTDDEARGLAADVALNFGLHRIDDLELEATVQRIEVAGPPLDDQAVFYHAEQLTAKVRVREERRDIQDRVLAVPAIGFGTDGLIHLVEGEQGEAESVLHPRTPEAVELPPEDHQGVRDGLIPRPAQTDVEQIQAKGTGCIGDVEEDDVVATIGWDDPEGGIREISMGIDQDNCGTNLSGIRCFGNVAGQAQEKRGLAATGLGDEEEVPPQDLVGDGDGNVLPLVRGNSDGTSLGDGHRQREEMPCGRALYVRHIGGSQREVPEAGDFPRGEQAGRPRGQGRKTGQSAVPRVERPRPETVAVRPLELTVGADEFLELGVEAGTGNGRRCEDGQANFDEEGRMGELFAHQARIDHLTWCEAANEPYRPRDARTGTRRRAGRGSTNRRHGTTRRREDRSRRREGARPGQERWQVTSPACSCSGYG